MKGGEAGLEAVRRAPDIKPCENWDIRSTSIPMRHMSHGCHAGVTPGKIHGHTCSHSPDRITPRKSEVFYSPLHPQKTFSLMCSPDPRCHLGQEARRLFKDLSLLTPRGIFYHPELSMDYRGWLRVELWK